MQFRVPRLGPDEALRALEFVGTLWSAVARPWLPSFGVGASQALTIPYRTLFFALQFLLIGREVTVRIGDQDVRLTVTEVDFVYDPAGLAVGQIGEIRLAVRDILWDERHLNSAVAVLRNVHIRPGAPPVLVAAPVELSTDVPLGIVDGMLRDAVPKMQSELGHEGRARLRWARRPGWGGVDVDAGVIGTTLWVQPRAVVAGQRSWKLPQRTPTYQVPLPDLPNGLLVTGAEMSDDALQVTGLLPEWRSALPVHALQSVISQLGHGAISGAWPSLRRGSE